MEKRIKCTINKAGGTASKNAKMTRIIIPSEWVTMMGITTDEPYVLATFDGETMHIRKDDSND